MTTKASTQTGKAVEKPIDIGVISTYQSGVVQSAAHRALRRLLDDILAPYNLTMMQWFFIGTIYDAGAKGVRMTDLARQIGTTMPYATTTVKVLERRGIVRRQNDDGDNRSRLVVIDDSYGSEVDAIENHTRQKMRESIYAQISPQELRTYIGVLYKLATL